MQRVEIDPSWLLIRALAAAAPIRAAPSLTVRVVLSASAGHVIRPAAIGLKSTGVPRAGAGWLAAGRGRTVVG